jgi:hypothetical protein
VKQINRIEGAEENEGGREEVEVVEERATGRRAVVVVVISEVAAVTDAHLKRPEHARLLMELPMRFSTMTVRGRDIPRSGERYVGTRLFPFRESQQNLCLETDLPLLQPRIIGGIRSQRRHSRRRRNRSVSWNMLLESF